MNIKRIYTITLCLCLSVLMTSVCFAVNLEEFAFYADDGTLQYDFDAYHYRLACDYVAESGYDLEPDDYWLISPVTGDYIGYDWDSFCRDYDALSATNVSNEIIESSIAPAEEDDTYDLSDVGSDGPVSVVLEDSQFNTLVELETDIPHQYVVDDLRAPTGTDTISFSYVYDVPLGYENKENYFLVSTVCPSNEDLLRGQITVLHYGGVITYTTGADEVANYSGFFNDEIFCAGSFIVIRNSPQTLYVDGLGGIKCTFPESGFYIIGDVWADWMNIESVTLTIPDYYGFPISGVDGGEGGMTGTLKTLVTSIFGEYTPIYSTEVIRETVNNETVTTLIDVVASGTAGVDWTWCAGVFLFGIMLFCLFKLLGGILS